MRKILLIAACFLLGCSSPQKAVYREAADTYMGAISKDWQEWAPKLVGTPANPNGQKDQLPTLTQKQYDNGLAVIKDYEKLRDDDRAHDLGGK